MADILEQIKLSPVAVTAWHLKAFKFVSENKIHGLIPDEQAEVLPDGRLRLYVNTNAGTCELILSADEWLFEQ